MNWDEKDANGAGILSYVIAGVLVVFICFILPIMVTGSKDIHTDEIVPLFQILIPYLFFVGAPLIITAIIVVLMKATTTGVTISKEIITGNASEKPWDSSQPWGHVDSTNSSEEPVRVTPQSIRDINYRHRRNNASK